MAETGLNRIIYNTIELSSVQFGVWQREAVVDIGNTYLYTKMLIPAVGLYSPEATSYRYSPLSTAAPEPGHPAALTDAVVRHMLMQPRKTLTIMVNGVIALRSPFNQNPSGSGQPLATDAHNGPICRFCDVQEVVGTKTYIVRWLIEVAVNECPGLTTGSGLRTPTIISHRWQATDEIVKPHYLTTRVINGHAILRTDLMLANGYAPDDFRAALFHPVGQNMQREDIQVHVSEDGSELSYTLVDQEQLYNLQGVQSQGITKVEAYHNAQLGTPSLDEIIVPLGRSSARTTGQLAGVAMNTNIFNVVQNSLAGSMIIGAGLFDLTLTALQLAPKQIHSFTVQVWGNRNSSKSVLEGTAWNIVNARLAATVFGGPGGSAAGFWASITHHLTGKYVEIIVRAREGIGSQFFNNLDIVQDLAGNIGRGHGLLSSFWRTLQSRATGLANPNFRSIMPGEALNLGPVTQLNTPNPMPPGSNFSQSPAGNSSAGARGTFVWKLAAQTLSSACSLPPAVPTLPLPLANERSRA
jgi:hypothetical protein